MSEAKPQQANSGSDRKAEKSDSKDGKSGSETDAKQGKEKDSKPTSEKDPNPITAAELEVSESLFSLEPEKDWEQISDKRVSAEDWYRIWRKPVEGKSYYSYKFVSAFPTSAKTYFDVQENLPYHMVWDTNCLEVRPISKVYDTELIFWLVKYPFPMANRDYVYHRRTIVHARQQQGDGPYYSFISRVTNQHTVPAHHKHVRVDYYYAKTVVRPLKSNPTKACEVYWLGTDDPKASVPSSLYNWVLKQGLPKFMGTIRKACDGWEPWLLKQAKQSDGKQPQLQQQQQQQEHKQEAKSDNKQPLKQEQQQQQQQSSASQERSETQEHS